MPLVDVEVQNVMTQPQDIKFSDIMKIGPNMVENSQLLESKLH